MVDRARVALCAATAVVAGLLATGLRAERVVGGLAEPSLVFEVAVPDEALAEQPAAAIEQIWRTRLRAYDVHTTPVSTTAGMQGVEVEIVGAGPDQQERVASALTSSAQLEVRLVLDGDRVMASWYQAIERGELPDIDRSVEAHPDAWVGPNGDEHVDSYLRASSSTALDRAVTVLSARYPLPDGARIAYESIELREPNLEGHDVPPGDDLRTYVLDDELILSNQDVASSQVVFDPQTQRPEVLLTLGDDGARRFGDATTEHAGRKIAILVEGRVMSAPIVMGPIRGGRVTITMGGSDPEPMLREAEALTGVLGSSLPLPAGIDARLIEKHDRPVTLVWALRALLALAAAVLAWVIAAQVARRRWFAPAPSVSPGFAAGARWDRLALPALVTLVLPLLLWFLSGEVVLPGINEIEMMNVVQDATRSSRAQFGVLALGLGPIASGFILVELYAILVEWLVPSRRGRRLGTPADRRGLDRAAWIVVTALAVMQAYFIAVYLEGLSMRGAEVFIGGSEARWLLVVTLTTGVMVQVVVAELISRHGLCNGYLALFGVGAALELIEMMSPPRPLSPWEYDRPSVVLLLAIAAAAALASLMSTRVRTAPSGPRLPYTGIVPASLVRGGIGLVALAALFSDQAGELLMKAQKWTIVAELGATVPFTLLILWSVKRPWKRPGVVATAAFLAVLVLLPFAVPEPYRLAVPLANGVLVGVVAAELWIGVRARVHLADATTVLVVHDVFRADEAADTLEAAAIPHVVHGARARAALRFTAAFAPVAVRVPATRVDEARALLTPAPSPPAS